jgi:hypothetical protein
VLDRSLYRADALHEATALWEQTVVVRLEPAADGWHLSLQPGDDEDLLWAFATHALALSVEHERRA